MSRLLNYFGKKCTCLWFPLLVIETELGLVRTTLCINIIKSEGLWAYLPLRLKTYFIWILDICI